MHRLIRIDWLYWAATVPLLTLGLFWHPVGIPLAIGLCGIQMVHFAMRSESLVALAVQVRGSYLALLLAGLWPPFAPVHWIQLVGTSVRVTTGYCLLARLLSLLPWNRSEKLSGRLILRRLFQQDRAGRTACTQLGCAAGK